MCNIYAWCLQKHPPWSHLCVSFTLPDVVCEASKIQEYIGTGGIRHEGYEMCSPQGYRRY